MKNASSPFLSRTRRPLRALTCVVAVASGVVLLAPRSASAHFILETPASWMSQDTFGVPEKAPPCGNEGGGTATGTITSVHPGETITVTINEVIFHPGHYRISIAADRSQLPAEPPVTAGSTACGSVPIDPNPTFPVLLDGVFEHTTAFTSPQSVQVTIPSNLTCTKCTLQVIEFMSDHGLNNPGGCFYHHCADLSVEPGDGSAGAMPDSGVDNGGDATTGGSSGSSSGSTSSGGSGSSSGTSSGSGGSSGGGSGDSPDASTGDSAGKSASGCGCSVPARTTPAFAGLSALFALVLLRLRRRAAR